MSPAGTRRTARWTATRSPGRGRRRGGRGAGWTRSRRSPRGRWWRTAGPATGRAGSGRRTRPRRRRRSIPRRRPAAPVAAASDGTPTARGPSRREYPCPWAVEPLAPEQGLDAAVEVGGPMEAELLEAEGGQAGGVALVADDHHLLVEVGDLGDAVGRRGVEAPFEDVAVDDHRS